MKIICPHCGVKGSAGEGLQGKKVRCPECSKVFRVTEQVLTGMCVEDQDVSLVIEEPAVEERAALESPVLPDGVEICSKCGFAFSEQFRETIGVESFCSLCALRRPIEG